MVFFYLMEALLILSVGGFIITQIIVPAFQGRPLFPIFRGEGRLESELAEARQKERESEMEQNLARKSEVSNQEEK